MVRLSNKIDLISAELDDLKKSVGDANARRALTRAIEQLTYARLALVVEEKQQAST